MAKGKRTSHQSPSDKTQPWGSNCFAFYTGGDAIYLADTAQSC